MCSVVGGLIGRHLFEVTHCGLYGSLGNPKSFARLMHSPLSGRAPRQKPAYVRRCRKVVGGVALWPAVLAAGHFELERVTAVRVQQVSDEELKLGI